VGIADLDELNDRFLGWAETVLNCRVHSKRVRRALERRRQWGSVTPAMVDAELREQREEGAEPRHWSGCATSTRKCGASRPRISGGTGRRPSRSAAGRHHSDEPARCNKIGMLVSSACHHPPLRCRRNVHTGRQTVSYRDLGGDPFYDVLVWYRGEPLAKVALRSTDSLEDCRLVARAAVDEPSVAYAEIRYHRNSTALPDGDLVVSVERF
jgi:hypothetical protein